jgi:hypothetical protein
MLGVALAASTWGLWLRRPGVTVAITAIGVVTLFLSLANYLGKPSGFGELWPRGSGFSWSEASIWRDTRSQAQVRLRPGGGELSVLEHVAAHVPTDADIAIAPRENDFLSPYFGPRLSRHVSLLRPGDPVPPAVEWLVLSPEAGVHECDGPFEETHSNGGGWRVARRVSPAKCYVASQAEP